MTRLAIVIRKAAPFGGLEKYCSKIVEFFLKKNIQVTLISEDSDQSHTNATSITLPPVKSIFPHRRLLQYSHNVEEALQKEAFDIILGMDRITSATHLRAGNGCHRAFLESRKLSDPFYRHWLHSLNPLHTTLLKLEKKGFESSSTRKIITNSHMVKREIMNYYDVSETKISVVHNGVEWKQLAFPFENRLNIKKDLIEKHSLSQSPFTFLFIGNDYRRKGLDRLLKALSGLGEEWHLIVIGKDRNIGFYQGLAKKLAIDSKVTFLGYVPSAAPFYALADCVVIPSLYDPFANVTVEALAMGCFVITSLSNGGSEIITPLNGTVIENMTDDECFQFHLRKGLQYDKSKQANSIRNSISYLDFDFQLNQLATVCLKNF